VSEPGYSLKSEKGDLQWKMLDQALHRLGRKTLDEVYNTYVSSPKKSYATLTTTATVWLWCNLTPSQALKVSSSHHEVYYDIFEQDHQALKNLCNAIKESIKRNPQLLHYQLFTLRYSL